jgi:hypothetical protein
MLEKAMDMDSEQIHYDISDAILYITRSHPARELPSFLVHNKNYMASGGRDKRSLQEAEVRGLQLL